MLRQNGIANSKGYLLDALLDAMLGAPIWIMHVQYHMKWSAYMLRT